MGRCPVYLDVDSFDVLAESLGLSLTDGGVSAIGEICEFIAIQILREAESSGATPPFNFDIIVNAAEKLGVKISKVGEHITDANL